MGGGERKSRGEDGVICSQASTVFTAPHGTTEPRLLAPFSGVKGREEGVEDVRRGSWAQGVLSPGGPEYEGRIEAGGNTESERGKKGRERREEERETV